MTHKELQADSQWGMKGLIVILTLGIGCASQG